ncbi:conserved protein of unknown function [Bradyrhizobium sp. ORS 285]|uniref:hypothetical protein n=1 Tax=Bradyrhizobium sp. ORS 285 TaxID=115808 RepID=UPI0002409A96|nr:hypothetical protein [Bradyrhizobium sp. ORS 285]CCD87551.1 conserved hypothetical protein [Bradyrhizobium sp. ORS 285]SMX60658.1 conserved protein of unknown function [Bradyrhizobium sp. ORS 285]
MLSQSKATSAAARAARRSLLLPCVVSATLLATTGLAACQTRTLALSDADPADPSARVEPVRTSSVIAPYTPLRPVAPTRWGQRDSSRAPRTEPSR